MPGGEIQPIERGSGRCPSVIHPVLGDDVEATQRAEVDPEGADGDEHAVVGRVLEDQRVGVGIDLEQLGGGRP
jgi:hypothetical protein